MREVCVCECVCEQGRLKEFGGPKQNGHGGPPPPHKIATQNKVTVQDPLVT